MLDQDWIVKEKKHNRKNNKPQLKPHKWFNKVYVKQPQIKVYLYHNKYIY